MRTSVALWLLLIAFGPSAYDRALLWNADSTVVRLEDAKNTGSGVVIGKHTAPGGCLLLIGTARHVAEENNLPRPLHLDGNAGPVSGRAVWAASADSAVVEFLMPTPCKQVAYRVALVSKYPARRGDKVFGAGYPLGVRFFSWGTISDVELLLSDYFTPGPFTTAIYPGAPGHSGGPLFNGFGQVVGLVVAGTERAPMLAILSTAAQLRTVAKQFPEWEI